MSLHNPHAKRGPQIPPRLVTLLTIVLLSSIIWTSETAAQDPEDVIRVRTDLVAIPVSVSDSHARRIQGLKSDDFAILDDGRVAKIDYFASGVDHVALAFLLDDSGSLREQIPRQRDAAVALFSRFGSGSSVAVIRFGRQARVVAPFTNEPAPAQAAFIAPGFLSERTAIFDAVLTTVKLFAARGENAIERRIAILISDGLDTASKESAQTAIAAANQANLSLYVIQLPLFTPRDGRLAPRPAAKGFRELAEKTGGKYFVAGNAQAALTPNAPVDLTSVFTAIEEDLRSQYVLGFYPGETSRDGQSHRVAISMSKSNKKFRVRQLRMNYSLKK